MDTLSRAREQNVFRAASFCAMQHALSTVAGSDGAAGVLGSGPHGVLRYTEHTEPGALTATGCAAALSTSTRCTSRCCVLIRCPHLRAGAPPNRICTPARVQPPQ